MESVTIAEAGGVEGVAARSTLDASLLLAALDFCQRFDTWIMNQAETVKFSSALAFGEEYRRLRELAAKEAVRDANQTRTD